MGNRRRTRELAMQALFLIDMRPDAVDRDLLDLFCRSCSPSRSGRPLFTELVQGVRRNLSRIDRIIERFSSNWKISRMNGVDRNVMRLAIYELLCRPEIPPKVSINEAIDIGKKYGSEESGAFINGILDAVHAAMVREELVPAPETEADPPPPAPLPERIDQLEHYAEPAPPPAPLPEPSVPAAEAQAPSPSPSETVQRVAVGRGLVRRRTVARPRGEHAS